jgi:hypothetical protein
MSPVLPVSQAVRPVSLAALMEGEKEVGGL